MPYYRARYVDPMSCYCWSVVCDASPALNMRINILCLLGSRELMDSSSSKCYNIGLHVGFANIAKKHVNVMKNININELTSSFSIMSLKYSLYKVEMSMNYTNLSFYLNNDNYIQC